jgi:hypothetical protein
MEHRDIYNEMLEKIEKCENFTYVRYNDGELDLIFKKNPGFSHILKIWGTEIEKESSKLRNILSKELEYYIGLCPGYTKNNANLLESIRSSLDPFCGVYSRTNHDEIMKKNDIEIDFSI